MQLDGNFHAAYRVLEERMKVLAETDGDVFLPNPEPEGPVQYVLICMEPSLGRWARSAEEARSKVDAGFRNFVNSIGDFILHFCARQYLCRPEESYHITDLAKGAMLVDHARRGRKERYDAWYPLLKDEIDLVLLDMVLPGMDGGEIFKILKELNPDVRVLLSSGYSLNGKAQEILNRGCKGFIQKPYRVNTLAKAIKDILGG